MNKLNDIFYKNAFNKMSEENIDDIKITVCILRIYLYIFFCILSLVIKTYEVVFYTHCTRTEEKICMNPLYSYDIIYVIIFFIKKKNVVLIFRYILVYFLQ